MTNNIFDFEAEPPHSAFVDSSFLLNILVDNSRFHKEYTRYGEKLKNNHTILFLSNLGLDEIWYILIKLSIIKDYGTKKWKTFINNPEVIKRYSILLDKTTTAIIEIPNLHLVEISISQTLEALNIIKQYGLLPRDAIHTLSAISSGIGNFITTDKDFNHITSLTIYTCNR